jgi:Uma2 family endonuclease
MTISAVKDISLEKFLMMPETKPALEFLDGDIIQKPMPKGRHSCLQYELCNGINQVTKKAKLAYAFPELRCSFGNRSIVPDIAVFTWEHIPFLANGEVPDRFEHSPDWVIEILSPEQKSNKVIGNILHCMEHGCKLGWFLDPDDLSILVFLCDRQPILMEKADILPVLAGIELKLTVDDVFGWLTMA